jgi:hypothetical protein
MKSSNSSLCVALVLASALSTSAAPTEKVKAAVVGQPVSLDVHPATIRLSGRNAAQQIIVTARYENGVERDLTPFCILRADADDVVKIGRGGFLQPHKDGCTTLVVEAGQRTARVPVIVEDMDKLQPVSFRHHMIAVLNVAGCNAGACHGIPSGRGGFKLSLRGYDPAADFMEITRGALGRRAERFEPDASLIWQKALGRVTHEGGQRFGANSVAERTMRAWLKEGMLDDPSTLPALTKLEIAPGSRLLTAPGHSQQLAVTAHFGDGSSRDVTRLTVFSSSDDGIAQVDGNGLVEFQQPGEAAILCRYLDTIQCVRLTYLEPRQDFHWPGNLPEHNYVDREVFAKLKLLNMLPSDRCTDQEFLRRVFLDLCGILPAPESVQTFLADNTPNKRARLIDQLVERPEFADFWAHKWLDLLRCNRLTIQIKGSHGYRHWLRDHIASNTPWNQVVRELLTASGSTFANPPANYYRGPYNNGAPVVRDANGLAESTAQIFLGIRLQCAQCHNHPFERWTQDDYYHMAAWFARLEAKPDPFQLGDPPRPYPWQLRENALVIFSTREGEVVQPRTGKLMAPKILGMSTPALSPGKDRRELLADLVTAPDNPYFARATVNRIWFHLLGKGIVDPPDDFRDSNPPANEALLDTLSRDFVNHKFDVKHIVRTIVNSRTYQLSAHGNGTNLKDDKYFSHALVKLKRLSAEVLLDAISTATGAPDKFTGFPPGTRAVQLPDGQVIYTGGRYASWDRHPFLKVLGQPAREAACECERESDVNLARVLELKNGEFVQKKLQSPDNRVGKLLALNLPDNDILNELFLATLSRLPLPEERNAALDVVAKTAAKRVAWETVQWALLNTNEFLLRH